MSLTLPAAEHQAPSCGACGAETRCDEPGYFQCDDCGLMFDGVYLIASYLDPEADPCGKPCTNSWHRPNAIQSGKGFECVPCALPDGHTSDCWHDCKAVRIDGASHD